jgi:hypothetical protein
MVYGVGIAVKIQTGLVRFYDCCSVGREQRLWETCSLTSSGWLQTFIQTSCCAVVYNCSQYRETVLWTDSWEIIGVCNINKYLVDYVMKNKMRAAETEHIAPPKRTLYVKTSGIVRNTKFVIRVQNGWSLQNCVTIHDKYRWHPKCG